MRHKIKPWQAFLLIVLITLAGYALLSWVLAFLITFVFGVSFGFLNAAGLVVIVVIIGGLLRKGGE
ncbi:hypothetical protein ACTP13_19360 [Paenibacillus peoriae]|uniref:hypothetical protein n=1 Tax=Paenibacillus peoriae TaxID=59893 RepID=UPI003F9516F8